MYTFQDLEPITNDLDKARFCKDAVTDFRCSQSYKDAVDGEAYYAKHNLTIENYQKMITTLSGAKRPDIFSANHKLKTLFFRRLTLQQIQYVLGNGVTLQNDNNKEKLGKDFDFKLITCAKRAMASGRGFGFWNLDHLEVFGYADTAKHPGFCPLYDEHTSELRAGIRFWFRYVESKEILRCTLFEEDGYTEYKIEDSKPSVVAEKRAYITNIKKTQSGIIEDVTEENYGKLPIVPLYANDTHESELVGIRECVDCYDLIKSGLANNIDDASEIYWILKNTGGMDDVDIARFMQRIKTVHGAAVDGDEGADAEAHQIQVPTEARNTMLEILRKDIYEDFQALDVNTLSASAKTTQEIQASYQAQDNKCADFEYFIIDFVQKILELAGIDDNPTFVWNKIINQAEQTNMILSSANYLTDEAVIKHLPFLTPEEADEIIKQRDAEAMSRTFDDEEEEETEEADEPQDEPQGDESEEDEE